MPACPDDHAGLISTLCRHGQLRSDDVALISPLHQRSLCYRIDLRDGTALFAKRAQRTAAGEWSADVAAEGARLRAVAGLLGRRRLVPRVRLVEPDERLLVTTFFAAHRQLDRPGTRQARALGGVLATVHTLPPTAEPALREVNHAATVADNLLYPTPRALTSFPAGYGELLAAVRSAGLAEPLAAAAAGWQTRSLVHGDIKSNNVLCRADGAPGIRLVDWETACWGDPRWDVGAVIGDLLFGWLRGIRFRGGAGLTDWLATADRPIEQARAGLAAFTGGYRRVGGALPERDVPACLAYAAMFLLQRALASALEAVTLPRLTLAALQVARQLLTRPAQIAQVLL